jgi:hypothetical protein
MGITKTPDISMFPYRGQPLTMDNNRYAPLPTPESMKKRTLFGIPLYSYLTQQVVEDETIQYYIDAAMSELEHILDLYISPIEFDERHDYSRHMQFWSFGYMKVDHAPIKNVKKYELTFNNGTTNGQILVDIPLEFIHTQPQEGTIQLVPANGVTISGLIVSLYSGLGFHAFSSQAISNWPGAIHVVYEAGFDTNKIPALLSSLIENMAAKMFLSSISPVLFPHNSTSVGIDGVSQSVSTMGPAFLQNRLNDLDKIIEKQLDAARGYYQKRFLISDL